MKRLELEGVSVAFGGVAALSGVSLDVAPTEIRGIIGPNGAGKTTLINVVCGLATPDTGSVRLNGQSIRGLKPSAIAALGLRRTFQTSSLFGGLTVLENMVVGQHQTTRARLAAICLGARSVRNEERDAVERSRKVLEFVGMGQFADRLGRELSFGQQRLVEIARALVSEPNMLLMDEPAVGLSLVRLADVDRLLRRIRDERFCRMWEFYLAASECAFRYQKLVVFQVQLARSVDTLPITRGYIEDSERALAYRQGLRPVARALGE